MLSLKDLKEYDVKNFDAAKLLRSLQGRRDILINLVVILATFFAVAKIYENRTTTARALTVQIKTLDEKVKAIVAYENTKAKLDEYTGTLSAGLGGASEVVEKINKLAILRNIQILSLAPAATTATDVSTKTVFRLSVTAPQYEDLGYFVSDIENGGYNLRIDKWSASAREASSHERRLNEQPPKQVIVEMEISAITFKK